MADTVFRSGKRRVFVSEPIDAATTTFALDEASAHYLTRVLRLREGTLVDVADGTGRLWQGVLQPQNSAWQLSQFAMIFEQELAPARILAAALIKPDRWEWMLEKAAELGVNTIIPLKAERSVVELEPRKAAQRLERWAKIVEGAARQCERLAPVHLETPTSLADVLARYRDAQALMLDEAVPKRAWPHVQSERPVLLFVGPEGGWSEEERAQLHRAGVIPCGLGSNVLRAETAAIAALTIVRALDDGLVS